MSNVLKIDRMNNSDLSKRPSFPPQRNEERDSVDMQNSPIRAVAHVAPQQVATAHSKAVTFVRWLVWAHNDEDEDMHPRRGKKRKMLVFFHPFSPFAQTWEFVSGILLLYSAAVTPLLIAFFTEEQGHCGRVPTIYMDMLVDAFFLVEIAVHFVTGQVHRGHVQLELYEVATKYLFHDFTRDLCASAPIAWVEFFLVSDEGCGDDVEQAAERGSASTLLFMRFIRMLKMLRLIKVLKIFNVMRDLCRMRPATIRLIKAGFMVFLMSHIGGCMWWFIKVQVDPDAAMQFVEDNDTDKTVASIYITTVYFMIATLCTVGYGDISATGDAERVFSIFAMCLGTSVFAIIVSNMSALAAGMQSRENQVLEEMDNVVDYMRTNGVDKIFEKQVQNFYMFKCRQNLSLEDDPNNNALRHLPDALQREIKVDINKKLMQAVWLFDGMTPDELVSIVDLFKTQQAIPDEVIVSDTETPHSLFIVIQGSIKLEMANRNDKGELLVNEDGAVFYQETDRIGKGEVFAEVGVILQCACPYRARAASFVELYRLSVQNLNHVFQSIPTLEHRLREGAEAKMDEYAELQELDASRDPVSRWYKLSKLMLKKHRGLDQADKAQNRLVQFSQARKGKKKRGGGAGAAKEVAGGGVEGVEEASADEDDCIQRVEGEADDEDEDDDDEVPEKAEVTEEEVKGKQAADGKAEMEKIVVDDAESKEGVDFATAEEDGEDEQAEILPPKARPLKESLAGSMAPPVQENQSTSRGVESGSGLSGVEGGEGLAERLEQLAELVGLYARWDSEQGAIAERWAKLSARHQGTGGADEHGRCRECGCAQRLRETLGSAGVMQAELRSIAAAVAGASSSPPPTTQQPEREVARTATPPMTGPRAATEGLPAEPAQRPAEGGIQGPVDAEAAREAVVEGELRQVSVRLTEQMGGQGGGQERQGEGDESDGTPPEVTPPDTPTETPPPGMVLGVVTPDNRSGLAAGDGGVRSLTAIFDSR